MPLSHLIALIINAHLSHVRSRRILGEARQQDFVTSNGRYEFRFASIGTDKKDLSCFKIEPTTRRSSFADMITLSSQPKPVSQA
jgi:hypothetical protein